MADTPATETTKITWQTRLYGAWTKFYAWAKLHPGIMIPATAYLAGVATHPILKLVFG